MYWKARSFFENNDREPEFVSSLFFVCASSKKNKNKNKNKRRRRTEDSLPFSSFLFASSSYRER